MSKFCILYLCILNTVVVKTIAQDVSKNINQPTGAIINNVTSSESQDNLYSRSNRTTNVTETSILGETDVQINHDQTHGIPENGNMTIDDEEKTSESDTIHPNAMKTSNETFKERVVNVFKRLFKREVVGSLVARGSEELLQNPKITVPWVFQNEYYALRKRKEEIERNKRVWADDDDKKKHSVLIDRTWELLVNWSQDHLAFEDKVIKVHKLKVHDHIQRSKDPDITEESDARIDNVDSDAYKDSDATLKPEFATEKNLMEVQEKYDIEKNIDALETKMKHNPKENNEKNQILLKQYKKEWKIVDDKFKKIREMKLNRALIEQIWNDKQLYGNKKAEGAADPEI